MVNVGALGGMGGMGVGSAMGLGAATQVLVQLASTNAVAPTGTAAGFSSLTPSAVVTISQLAQEQAAQALLSGQGAQSDATFGELAQALILALLLQLLEPTKAA